MNLDMDMSKEYFNSIYYMKNQRNSIDVCLVCLIDETEEGKIWTKTSLICGHVCHSRCYRRWCGVKRCLNCQICGVIQEINQNRFCSSCNEFVYCDIYEGRPVIEKQIYESTNSMEQPLLIFIF